MLHAFPVMTYVFKKKNNPKKKNLNIYLLVRLSKCTIWEKQVIHFWCPQTHSIGLAQVAGVTTTIVHRVPRNLQLTNPAFDLVYVA